MRSKKTSTRKTVAKRPLKTLDRVLSKAGLGSRTDARQWIGAGRVAVVNGKEIATVVTFTNGGSRGERVEDGGEDDRA